MEDQGGRAWFTPSLLLPIEERTSPKVRWNTRAWFSPSTFSANWGKGLHHHRPNFSHPFASSANWENEFTTTGKILLICFSGRADSSSGSKPANFFSIARAILSITITCLTTEQRFSYTIDRKWKFWPVVVKNQRQVIAMERIVSEKIARAIDVGKIWSHPRIYFIYAQHNVWKYREDLIIYWDLAIRIAWKNKCTWSNGSRGFDEGEDGQRRCYS